MRRTIIAPEAAIHEMVGIRLRDGYNDDDDALAVVCEGIQRHRQ